MKATLTPGLAHRFSYVVPENKTVPHLYPEATDFQDMPKVFATGFMVGLMEWACIQLMQPHLDPGEGSLGFTLMSATPPRPRPVHGHRERDPPSMASGCRSRSRRTTAST
jgi:fluoroacetyl-CoA thioesterase